MKEFYDLLAKNGHPIPTDGESSFTILSATTVSNGYALITRRTWADRIASYQNQ